MIATTNGVSRVLRSRRRAIVVTLDQTDRLVEDSVEIEVVPAWRWMA